MRPLALGELYDGAFQAIRTNPRTMIGVSAIVVLITTLIGAIPQALSLSSIGSLANELESGSTDSTQLVNSLDGLLAGVLIPAVLTWLSVTVLSGILMVAVSAAVLGRLTPLPMLWKRVRGRILALIGLVLSTGILTIVLCLLLFVPGLLTLLAGRDALPFAILLLVLGWLGSICLYIFLWVKWSLAAPALLLEDQSIVQALRRSWQLVRGGFWRLLGIMLLTGILVSILSGIVGVPFAAIASLLQPGGTTAQAYSSFSANIVNVLISGIGQVIAGAILYPFSAGVTALLYIDVRMRREGLDVELMRAVSSQP